MARRILATSLTLAFFMCPFASHAHPHPIRWVKHHKLLVATSALLIAADAADTESTVRAQRRCPSCYETALFMGKHPSPARLWSITIAEDAALCTFNWYVLKQNPDYKFEKALGIAVTSGLALSHALGAYHNAGLPERPVPAALPNGAWHSTLPVAPFRQ
ncbi:MAG: hypothetical protein ACREQ5_08880 [Candidatus Dormibacteria bacterium]